MSDLINPLQFLKILLNKKVKIKLKWEMEYIGTLVEFDNYFNFVLKDVIEIVENQEGHISKIVIRCNNVESLEEVL